MSAKAADRFRIGRDVDSEERYDLVIVLLAATCSL